MMHSDCRLVKQDLGEPMKITLQSRCTYMTQSFACVKTGKFEIFAWECREDVTRVVNAWNILSQEKPSLKTANF